MTKHYEVSLTGLYRMTYRVEAEDEEEAKRLAMRDQGIVQFDEWLEEPEPVVEGVLEE